MALKEKIIYKSRYWILLLCSFAAVIFQITDIKAKNIAVPLIIIFSGIAIFACIKLMKEEKNIEKPIILIIFLLGFLFRLIYIQSTDYYIRQHDVGGNNGHYAYIMRLYMGEGLPDTVEWQYYQPPVWHSICALWLRIQNLLGISMENALENLQVISLFASSAIMLLTHKLLKMFRIQGIALGIGCAVIAFHPTMIILSGSINNDVFALMLALCAVILALKWYRNPKLSTIIALAFALGISMGIKLTGGLVAVGIALLFAVRFFEKGNKNRKNMFGQFAAFGIICVPIALWWQIRNMICFDKPLTYVPMLSEKNTQYIGFRSFSERIFDFSSLWENGVYPARVLSSQNFEYFDHNIPLTALKTSVFGEYYIGQNTNIEIFGKILFWSALILAVISVCAAIWVIIKAVKAKKDIVEKIYPFIISAVMIFSYVKFCFEFAHFCTMDFRYIAMTLIFGVLYIGLLIGKKENKNTIFSKILVISTVILTLLLSFSSGILYLTIR